MSNDSYGYFGSGAPYFGFPVIGTKIKGTIIEEPETRQQVNPVTQELKTFKNGDPMTVLVVTLKTDLRDADIVDDDGKRSVWLSSKGQKQAVGKALREARVKGLDIGGELSLAYTGDGEKSNPAMNAPKLFSAHYVPGSPSSAYFAEETASLVAPQPVSVPVAQPVAQAVPVNLPPGMTPEVWNGLTEEARTALSSLAG